MAKYTSRYTGEEIDELLTVAKQAIEGTTDIIKDTAVQEILAELQGLPVFGVIDENNIVTVTSLLPDGTYTLKYENADGTTTSIGVITVGNGGTGGGGTGGGDSGGSSGDDGVDDGGSGDTTETANLLSSALTHTDLTTVFNGIGYMDGAYASAAAPYYNSDAATFCTGLMNIPTSGVVYIKGVTFDTSNSHNRLGIFRADGTSVNTAIFNTMSYAGTLTELGDKYYSLTFVEQYIGAYFYFSAMGTGDNCIVSATPIV